jgi:hypothetical protein
MSRNIGIKTRVSLSNFMGRKSSVSMASIIGKTKASVCPVLRVEWRASISNSICTMTDANMISIKVRQTCICPVL